ncbi:hypothetical protein Tco_0738696 [Tanacetum coccineum]
MVKQSPSSLIVLALRDRYSLARHRPLPTLGLILHRHGVSLPYYLVLFCEAPRDLDSFDVLLRAWQKKHIVGLFVFVQRGEGCWEGVFSLPVEYPGHMLLSHLLFSDSNLRKDGFLKT